MKRMHSEKGFTLIEVVVAAVLVLMAGAIVIPMLLGHIDRNRMATINADVMAISAAVKAAALRDGGIEDVNGDGNLMAGLIAKNYLDREPLSIKGATWALKSAFDAQGRTLFYLDIECSDAKCEELADRLDKHIDDGQGPNAGNIQWASGT